MKKVILFSLIFCLIFMFGCTSNTKPEPTNQSSQQTQIYKIGDNAQWQDYVLTVHGTLSAVPYEDNEYDRPEAGSKYFAVEVTIENKGSEVKPYNIIDFKLQDGDGYTYDSTTADVMKQPWFGYGDLQPGRKIRGWITFEIPKTASKLELIYQPGTVFDTGQIIVKLE